jgi:hypothetical protein
MGRRPFWIGGNIEYKTMLPSASSVLFYLAEATSSRLLHMVHTRTVILSRPALYQEISEYAGSDADFFRSYQTTLEVMKMARGTCGGIEIFAFSVRDQPALFYDAFLNIMEEVGVDVMTEVPKALSAAESGGVEIRAADGGHWNENGHEIVGVTIAKAVSRLLGTSDASGRDRS